MTNDAMRETQLTEGEYRAKVEIAPEAEQREMVAELVRQEQRKEEAFRRAKQEHLAMVMRHTGLTDGEAGDAQRSDDQAMPATRAGILETARQIVTKDREAEHGKPGDNFGRIANLWNAYLGDMSISPADVAAMMALLKIARLRGNSTALDNWVDTAGYAACGGELAKARPKS